MQKFKEQKAERAMAQESGELDKNLQSYKFFSIQCTIVGIYCSYITVHQLYNTCKSFILSLNYLSIVYII